MLTELEDLQQSDESVYGATTVSFTIQTRMKDEKELVERTYSFEHAEEWDKWVFHEFEEKRCNDTSTISERNWRRTKHIMWNDVDETRTIDVPPEVGRRLKDAIGADSVTIQIPSSSIRGTHYHEVVTYD